MKISIAIPSTDIVYSDFAMCLTAMVLWTAQKGILVCALINRKGSIIAQNRCALVDESKAAEATHILFLDSDHIVPKDLIVKLAAHDKDIVGVHQVTKRMPVRSNCEDLKGNRLTKAGQGLEEVTRLGTGIMLVNMKVFEHMKRPYFDTSYETGMFAKAKGWVGEDYKFCEEARHEGFKIYCDHEASKECFHLGTTAFGVTHLETKDGN